MGKVKSASYSQDYIKAQMQAGLLRFSKKRSRAKVWDIFARIEDQNGIAIPNIVMCKTCNSLLKFYGCTSKMMSHKCYRTKAFSLQTEDPLGDGIQDTGNSKSSLGPNADEKATDKVAQAVMEWCVENCRPLNITKDSGLRKLVSVLLEIGSECGRNVCVDELIPETGVIAWNIETWYKEKLKQARLEMSCARTNGYSVTIAEEKDSNAESFFLSGTVHYVREGRKCTQLLGVTKVPWNKYSTDSYITKYLDATLKDLHGLFDGDLFDDDPIFVYDKRTSLKTLFEGRENLFCINSLLDRVVEKAFYDVIELRSILKMAKELVILGVLPTPKATGLVEIHHILNSLEVNWGIITSEAKEQLESCSVAELVAINKLLTHFEKCYKTLASGSLPTLHLVIPHIHRLRKFCAGESSCATELDLKRALMDNLDWMVIPCITKYHMMAHFLFPPTNGLLQFSKVKRDETIDCCKKFMKLYCSPQQPEKMEHVVILGEGELFREPDFEPDDDLFSDFVAIDSQEDKIAKEIREYQSIQMPYNDGFNVLEWWHSNQELFPLLFKTSCQILSIPASIAPSTSVLSQAKNLIKDPACSIDELHRIMFLKINLDKKS